MLDYLLELADTGPAMAALVAFTVMMFALAVGFLIAASVLRRANNQKASRWAVLETSWGVSVSYIARGMAGPETLHYGIKPEERLLLLDFLYKLAISNRDPQSRELYAQLARPYLPLLESRTRDGDIWQRARALRTYAELGGTESAPAVVRALDDPNTHVALTAARIYGTLNLGPIEGLLERIDRYQTWDRRLLRLTLTAPGTAAVPALHRVFADEKQSAGVRAVCGDALAALGYGGANQTAINVLASGDDVNLRAAALRVIRAPVSDMQRQVVRQLCSSEDSIERAQAVACFARIAEDTDMEVLENALADLSPWVVLNASKGLSVRRRSVSADRSLLRPAVVR